MAGEDDELVLAFIAESQDMLDDVEPKLIELQQLADGEGKVDNETINAVFRLFHSIKGSAGFLQLNSIASVTHEAETLLDLVRKGNAVLSSSYSELLFRACDMIRTLLATVESTFSDAGHEEDAGLVVQGLSKAIEQVKQEGAPTEESKASRQEKEAPESVVEPPPCSEPETVATQEFVITPEMFKLFAQDAEELLDTTEQALLSIKNSPDNPSESIQEALRALHTFKGNCGFVSLSDLESLSHKSETVLELAREGSLTLETFHLKTLLKIVDIFRRAVGDLMQGGDGTIEGCAGLTDLLSEMTPKSNPEAKAVPTQALPPAPENPAPAPSVDDDEQQDHPANSSPKTKNGSRAAGRQAGLARRDIRVNVDKLDYLGNLVGELVIAEALVTHSSDLKGLRLDNFERAAHDLNRITEDLQDIAMSLRMVPVEGTFKRMIRLVHDVSIKAGKKVALDLIGEETEVDKTIVELISDPLVHIVRNSVDHGIEPPEERLRLNKPEEGLLTIEAKHSAGEVWIVSQGRWKRAQQRQDS